MDKRLAVNFAGVAFPNPFTLAASPPSDTRERIDRAFAAGWGGAVFKTTSVASEVVDLVYPMMGGISYQERRHAGFFNIDLISERHIQEICDDTRYLKSKYPDRVLIGSIMAGKRSEWEELVQRLEDAGIDIIECSQSCPQGEEDGVIPAADPDLTREVTGWIKKAVKKNTPIIVKMTPNVTDISAIAKAAQEGGADAVCGIDTVMGFSGIDIDTFEPKLNVRGKSTFGGLSGPMVKPIALACVAQMAQAVNVPIAGVGGISDWRDAVEFLCLGASTVQLCTAVMRYGIEMIEDLNDGLSHYLDAKKLDSVADLVGRSLPYLTDNDALDRAVKVKSNIDRALCIKCNGCYVACRDGGYNAISIEKDGVAVDKDKCRGCGVCLSVCPVDGCMSLKGGE